VLSYLVSRAIASEVGVSTATVQRELKKAA
jgi:IS30 family transposase